MSLQTAAELPLSTSLRIRTLMGHALYVYQTTAAIEELHNTTNNKDIAAKIAAMPAPEEGLSDTLLPQTTESFAYAAELNDRLKQFNSVIAELGKRTHSTNDSVTSVTGAFFGQPVSTTDNNDSSSVAPQP